MRGEGSVGWKANERGKGGRLKSMLGYIAQSLSFVVYFLKIAVFKKKYE